FTSSCRTTIKVCLLVFLLKVILDWNSYRKIIIIIIIIIIIWFQEEAHYVLANKKWVFRTWKRFW
ncbi:MAG: hypothetical protein N7Q72_04980, partial [Spiroplasma sp. Tabriz.8]|nr:hypothetical protein [Spiroplasma sp. Tabriz.8]